MIQDVYWTFTFDLYTIPLIFDQPNCELIIWFAKSNVHFEVSSIWYDVTRLETFPSGSNVVVENHTRTV